MTARAPALSYRQEKGKHQNDEMHTCRQMHTPEAPGWHTYVYMHVHGGIYIHSGRHTRNFPIDWWIQCSCCVLMETLLNPQALLSTGYRCTLGHKKQRSTALPWGPCPYFSLCSGFQCLTPGAQLGDSSPPWPGSRSLVLVKAFCSWVAEPAP